MLSDEIAQRVLNTIFQQITFWNTFLKKQFDNRDSLHEM